MKKQYEIDGVVMEIYDEDQHGLGSSHHIVEDLKKDLYGFKKMIFKQDDVVIDIGSHVGIVSIYLAKKYLYLKIYSYEPYPCNYKNLVKNIEINDIKNISCFNLAVSGNGNNMIMIQHPSNTGGATSQVKNVDMSSSHSKAEVKSITLNDIFINNNIDKCKLLKIDCEGSEHEILCDVNVENLKRVEYMCGEFHINSFLKDKGFSIKQLKDYCVKYIEMDKMFITDCNMIDI